ncbi:D-alanyl-D-alanine carboxypeptidase [Alicyclobacillus sp. SO9]|nr:D-alanyl-D-alanine carboxypeptidase [Alicyclobacillus sp. SO9]
MRWGALAAGSGLLSLSLLCSPNYADVTTKPTSVQSNSFHQSVVVNQTLKNGVPMIATKAPHPPHIVSQAAVVMDLTTGTIVYAKNPQVTHYPASLTKIMTALIAMQKGHLTDELTASKLATEQPPDKLYLVPGEQEPLQKLLYGMLLNSANDAAVVIAQNYGGSIPGFAKLMNQEAHSLGANHTHFVNPSGLPNPRHVTTAYDMAVITRAAMQEPLFRKIVRTRHFQWNGEKWHRNLVNINSMLFSYPGAIGVKTGYTSVAHETLAVAATRGNQTFLTVLLDAPLNREIDSDATNLLNYAFKNYKTVDIVKKGTVVSHLSLSKTGKQLPVLAGKTMMATVLKNQSLYSSKKLVFNPHIGSADPSTGQIGKLEFLKGGSVVASDPLVLPPHSIPKTHYPRNAWNFHFHWWRWVIASVAGALVILAFIRRSRRRRKRKYSARYSERSWGQYYRR